jgi:hypothetical protein
MFSEVGDLNLHPGPQETICSTPPAQPSPSPPRSSAPPLANASPRAGSRVPSATISVRRLPKCTWASSAWHTVGRATPRAGTDSRGYPSVRIVFAPPPSAMCPSNRTASSSGRASPPEWISRSIGCGPDSGSPPRRAQVGQPSWRRLAAHASVLRWWWANWSSRRRWVPRFARWSAARHWASAERHAAAEREATTREVCRKVLAKGPIPPPTAPPGAAITPIAPEQATGTGASLAVYSRERCEELLAP